ncbi:hypothetical protein LXL04_001496 [Taraxacum kok-saghyz]
MFPCEIPNLSLFKLDKIYKFIPHIVFLLPIQDHREKSDMFKAIRVTTLCMIAILLLSMLSHTTARPTPIFKDVTPMETHHTDEEVANARTEEKCTGPGEEECLMRRTLAAHLDYIYTRNKPTLN